MDTPKVSSCDIIIDTNIALHFQPVDQIDWLALAGCQHCTVIIAPILLRELEHKKIFSPSATLKARAARVIDFLVEKMEDADPIRLRSNVTLDFIEHEPTLNFEENHLSREVNDDHYIATALERKNEKGHKTYIASNDSGLALKLRARSISILRLPEELRLPAELDATEKELRNVKAQLARIQLKSPKLSVTFTDNERKRTIRNARSMPFEPQPLAMVRNEYPLLPVPKRKEQPWNGDIAGLKNVSGLQAFGSANRIERYNSAVQEYYEEYEKYLSDMEVWLEYLRRSASITLELHNEGLATATNIDATLYFPQSVVLCRVRDFPDEPKEPKPPAKPGTSSSSLGPAIDLNFPYYNVPDINIHDGAIFIDEDDRTASFSAKSLKQKCMLTVDEFILIRPADLNGKGIEVDVEITLNEGEPVSQKLALTFAEVEAELSDD